MTKVVKCDRASFLESVVESAPFECDSGVLSSLFGGDPRSEVGRLANEREVKFGRVCVLPGE